MSLKDRYAADSFGQYAAKPPAWCDAAMPTKRRSRSRQSERWRLRLRDARVIVPKRMRRQCLVARDGSCSCLGS